MTKLLLFICCGYNLVSLTMGALFTSNKFKSYRDTKDAFYQKNLDKFNHDQAKAWFAKRGFGEEFDDYFEAREFFEKKGSVRPGSFGFAREGEEVNKDIFHDVMAAMYQTEIVYDIAKLREQTRKLAFTDEELKIEVVKGKSFRGHSKQPMVQLLQGNLKVSKDPNEKTSEIKVSQLEDVLRYPGYDTSRFANELPVAALQGMKANKTYLYKFDSKYSKSNLVYSIAGRERGVGPHADETDLFLTFRGSQTKQDWISNIKAQMVEIQLRKDVNTNRSYLIEGTSYQKIEIENALHDELQKIVDEVGAPIRVHGGFLGYLFADRGQDGLVDDDKDNDSMYTNIRLNVVRLLDQTSTVTNKLYVTGHSLGGALSTVASFFLACDKEINNRSKDWRGIKNVSFASPQVGNISFQRAIEALKSKSQFQSSTTNSKNYERLFQVFRFTNNRDPVPYLVLLSIFRQSPGVHIHLNRPSLLSFWRPRKPNIKAMTAHWKTQYKWREPLKIFDPTSIFAGLKENSLPALGLFLTTIPAILVIPFLGLKQIFGLIPPTAAADLGYVIQMMANYLTMFLPLLKPLMSSIFELAGNPLIQKGSLAALVTSMFYLFTKKNCSTVQRYGFLSVVLYFVNEATKNQQSYVVAALLAAQIPVYFLRKPTNIVKFNTHSMSGPEGYYEHFRPHHAQVSSTDTLTKTIDLAVFDENQK